MLKRILGRFRQDRGLHKATLRVEFFSENRVTPHLHWHQNQDQTNDLVPLVVFFYARILYELAELNETRVARQVIDYLEKKFCDPLVAGEGSPQKPRLSLGKLHLVVDPAVAAMRSYQAEFYQYQAGGYRLDFQGAIGKESFYLPAAFLAFLQSCLENQGEETLKRLARALARLHAYYRYRRDFWDGAALVAGPVFALGREEIKPEEATPEV